MTAPADVKTIFGKALELPSAADRAAYLDQACGGDAALRAEVEGLLQALEAAGPFLNRPDARKGETADRPGATPGTVLAGRYKLLEEIGAGGMGTVWVAEQIEPVRRKVAVKLVKAGMDSRHVLARFEQERQALAVMDHPNIAKVLDGGTTEQGRPFFVMEYVKGVPITEYCDDARLTVKERLALFVPVCQAVQHAHQKGIIHRDLKPSNILVCLYDGVPVPNVIDFGLAKALHQPLTEHTLHTGHGVLLGTPLYMSPEQAEWNNLDVDTRADVYALGVILYELLTGTTPLERRQMKEAAWQEVVRLIKEEEPPKPSTRLSASKGSLPSLSAQRHTEPARLARLVRGELDWIVMRALEKDRSRRYQTANGLARDVERYLAEEPVEACPPGAGYRLRKLARRYRKSLATAAAFLLLLLLAGALTTWQAVRVARAERAAAEAARAAAERERDERLRQARAAQEAQEALSQAEALVGQSKWEEAQAVVRRAEALLEAGLRDDPLARRVRDLGRDLEMVNRLNAVRLRGAAEDRFDAPAAAAQYEEAFREYGLDLKVQSAETAAERVRRSPIREDLVAGLDDWAARGEPPGPGRVKLRAVADAADDNPWRRALRAAAERKDAARLKEMAESPEALAQPPAALSVLGAALAEAGLNDEAVALLRRAQARHPHDFWINYELAHALGRLRPPPADEAVGYYRAALSLRPNTPEVHLNLGNALLGRGNRDEAIAQYRQAIALDPKLAEAHCELGLALKAQGDFAAALAALKAGHELGSQRKDWPYPSAEWLACCAALAAASPDTKAPERPRLRRQALDLLRADLARHRQQSEGGKPAEQAKVQRTFQRWQRLPDLAGVRDAAALAQLPADEREAWQRFWADVRELGKKSATR
jgi:serine/threonine protein kinase/tetratricopeptide (TPR) repeat protein